MSSPPHYNKFSSGDPKSGGFFEFIALKMRQVSLLLNTFFFFLKIQACDFDKSFCLDML